MWIDLFVLEKKSTLTLNGTNADAREKRLNIYKESQTWVATIEINC